MGSEEIVVTRDVIAMGSEEIVVTRDVIVDS
jgi:hypothetical protein